MTSQPAETTLAGVARELGVPEANLRPEALKKLTRKQLLATCQRIGLKGVTKLKKADLADRLWDEIGGSMPSAAEAGKAPADEASPDGRPKRPEPEISWSYGRDRVTAMAVDPERLCVYWEVTDGAIARARERLGPGGPTAWLSLRVYDTTGRIFDGTNAQSYFDHKVARHDRQWFLRIGKAASEAFVEVGMKSGEGYFVKIARSGRVEFPRREPVAGAAPRWMTVRVDRGRPEAEWSQEEGSEAAGPAAGFEPSPTVTEGPAPLAAALEAEAADDTEESVFEWTEFFPTERLTTETRSFEWRGPWFSSSWEAGPFFTEQEMPGPVTESFAGDVRIRTIGERTHIVYGPWKVEIRGLDAFQRRAVLGRWEIYRSWVSEEGHKTVRTAGRSAALGGSSEFVGASERRWLGGSEQRLGGASELLYLGASERRFQGASERWYLGASERRYLGASERRWAGGSERRLKGASERRLGGASERRLGGASEAHLGGASEARLGGAGDGGASDGSYPAGPGIAESQ